MNYSAISVHFRWIGPSSIGGYREFKLQIRWLQPTHHAALFFCPLIPLFFLEDISYSSTGVFSSLSLRVLVTDIYLFPSPPTGDISFCPAKVDSTYFHSTIRYVRSHWKAVSFRDNCIYWWGVINLTRTLWLQYLMNNHILRTCGRMTRTRFGRVPRWPRWMPIWYRIKRPCVQ